MGTQEFNTELSPQELDTIGRISVEVGQKKHGGNPAHVHELCEFVARQFGISLKGRSAKFLNELHVAAEAMTALNDSTDRSQRNPESPG